MRHINTRKDNQTITLTDRTKDSKEKKLQHCTIIALLYTLKVKNDNVHMHQKPSNIICILYNCACKDLLLRYRPKSTNYKDKPNLNPTAWASEGQTIS